MQKLGYSLLAVFLLAACSTSPVPEVADVVVDDIFIVSQDFDLDSQSHSASKLATYKVTIKNFTSGQPFTPPVAATHPKQLRLFKIGTFATEGVKEIAENGNVTPLLDALSASPYVRDSVLALGADGDPPPILPGTERSFRIRGKPGDVVSFVSMLICTNDGFAGSTVHLPKRVGTTFTRYVKAHDAGTEINTEAFEDLVPPCALLTLGKDKGGTGESNPKLAENRRTRVHRNIVGNADLLKGLHGWTRPVAKIKVKRLN